MNFKTKKIIAKEFLLLVTTIILSLLVYSFTYLYNYLQKNKVKSLEGNIIKQQQIADSLIIKYDQKTANQEWLHTKLINEYNVGTDPNYSTKGMWSALIRIAENDSITIRWQTKWENGINSFFRKQGFNNAEDLKIFILANKISEKDIENKKKGDVVRTQIIHLENEKNKISRAMLSSYKQLQIGLWTSICLFIVLFLFRYLYYSIKWSFKTLNQTAIKD